MQGFMVRGGDCSLPHPYPTSAELAGFLKAASRTERELLACLWFAEGMPCAFKQCPLLWGRVKRWLASRIDVHQMQITVVGSARIGYSLDPSKYGHLFGAHSDLDLGVVCSKRFAELQGEFQAWGNDYRAGRATARSDREKELWDENLLVVEKNLRRGFIDCDKIPTLAMYPKVRLIRQAMWECKEKLAFTDPKTIIKRASLRVYRDWGSFVGRLSTNLASLSGE